MDAYINIVCYYITIFMSIAAIAYCRGVIMLFSIDTIHEDGRYRNKDMEKAKIFQCLCISNNNTRKMIAEYLRLRSISVSKIIKELIEDRLVFEGELKQRSGKGRPEIQLYPNYSHSSAISIYVVSREIIGTLVNLNGEILDSHMNNVPEDAENIQIAAILRKTVNGLITNLPECSRLIGIGTSLPGTVSAEQGRWISSARWPNLNSLDIAELLLEYNTPLSLSRSLDPELEFLLFNNERYRQGGTLLFHWGYGIGSAYALDGKVIRSSLGRFGEVGHWQINPESKKKCSCGSFGCLETEAALWAILPEIRKSYPEAPEDEPAFTTFLRKNRPGDREVIKNALRYVSTSLANLCKIFYPDRILLYGSFVEESSLFHKLKVGFNSRIPEYTRSAIKLEVVSGFQGALLGSVYHLFRNALRPLLRTRGNV